MRVVWLQPWAWAGLAALAAPILIHLLARHRQRQLLFPTLRFVRVTQLAALERRVIADVPLLVVRLLILTAAIAALAAPVFVSAARQQTWAARTARAIVTPNTPSSSDRDPDVQPLIESERSTAFASRVFGSSAGAASAIADAITWLDRQPPAARELVVVGDVREGAMSAADVASVPATTGIRFLPIASREPIRTAALGAAAETGGRTAARSLLTTLDDERTRVTYGPSSRSVADLVIVHAAAGEEAMAAAVRDAVLAEGVRLPRDDSRRLAIEFAGASPSEELKTPPAPSWMRETLAHLPGLTGGERGGRLVVRLGVGATDPSVVHLVDRVVRAAWTDPLDALEPRRIPAAILAAWSRGPSESPLETPPGNEGDARWLWVLALALLALEWWMRRVDRKVVDTVPQPESEARVA